MNANDEGSTFVMHAECTACGSRDNNAVYSDNHTHCFGCGAHTKGDGQSPTTRRPQRVALDLITSAPVGLHGRKITEQTVSHFSYGTGEYNGRPCQVAPYYDAEGQLIAQKIRFQDKSFKVLGDITNALPFGANVWPKTGRMIIVTEGELDAMSMSQVQGNKYPVVSISCGADKPTDDQGNPLPMSKIRKYFAKHRDYFLGFEKVVLMFDNDEPGIASAQVAASVIGRRAHIATLPLNDVSDMLVAGRVEEIIKAMWGALPYRPEGIVDMSTLKDQVKVKPEWGLSWFLDELTQLTYGIRTRAIYAFGAGTGVGKTDFFTQQIKHMVVEHKVPVAVFSLEQGVVETATRIAGKLAGKTFHIPDSGWLDSDKDVAWDKLMQCGKVFLYDSFGANEWSTIREKIEYLAHAEGVQYFFVDHLTALAAAENDERTALERIMSEMGAMVQKLDIAIFLISHLATPEGKPHEEGGRVMIRHFKGSRSIGFWSHFMFGLERDQQAENPIEAMTTTLRVLKDRYTGRATGERLYLGYDRDTGLLYPTTAPEERDQQQRAFDTGNEPAATSTF